MQGNNGYIVAFIVVAGDGIAAAEIAAAANGNWGCAIVLIVVAGDWFAAGAATDCLKGIDVAST